MQKNHLTTNNLFCSFRVLFTLRNKMPRKDCNKKRRLDASCANQIAVCNDIRFPKLCSAANYEAIWRSDITESEIYGFTACWESAVMFAAREGWVRSKSPKCSKPECSKMNNSSYLKKRSDGSWCWRKVFIGFFY